MYARVVAVLRIAAWKFHWAAPFTGSGRFGYGVAMKIRDSANPKRIHASFVRSLREDFAALPDVEGSLEALIQLDHR